MIALYYNARRIREVELEIAKRYKQNRMRCPVHLSVGQEAISAAFQYLVKKKDYAMSSHRSHAHYLAKGGSLKKMIAELYGKKDGCSKGIGGSMHLIDTKANFMGTSSIVGNSIPISVGLGLSLNLKNKIILVILFGDGAWKKGFL